MAERRMVSKVISVSKKFNVGVNDHFTRLLYVLLIPHSDDFGRLSGDPFKVKGLVLPMMFDVTHEEVEESLNKLHDAQLIVWYEVDGEKYIQINNFDEHQSGLHKRTKSKFPEPPNDFREIPGKSEKFPLELELEEEQEKKNNTTTTAREIAQQRVIQAYIRVKNRELTPFQLGKLMAYIDNEGFDHEVIVNAIERAGVADSSGIRLIETIINDYADVNAKTLDKARTFDAEFDSRKKNRGDPRFQNKHSAQFDIADKIIEEEKNREQIRSG